MQIQKILESNQVVELIVRDASLFNDFEQLLNDNKQIRALTITNSDAGLLADESCKFVRHLATFDNLSTLSLNVNELMSENDNVGQALALLLKRNKLQELELYGDVYDADIFFAPMHDALLTNTSLKHLRIYCRNFGDGILPNIAAIIDLKGTQNFKLTLDGLGSFSNAPIEGKIGFDNFITSVANTLNSTEVFVIAQKYLYHTIAAYNAIMPVQAIKKKLQERARENYMSDLHTIVPCLDDSLLALPEVLFGHIMKFVPGLHETLRLVYPQHKTVPELQQQLTELQQQLIKDIHKIRCEILWANTMREQVLGHYTIRTGLYFDAMRKMHGINNDAVFKTSTSKKNEETSTRYKM